MGWRKNTMHSNEFPTEPNAPLLLHSIPVCPLRVLLDESNEPRLVSVFGNKMSHDPRRGNYIGRD